MAGVRNVVLVTVDALRADYCSFIEESEDTTPFLDELASDGVVFEEAMANGPGTPASFSSLLSSTYPLMYGGYESFSTDRPAVQAHLSEHGFETCGIHSNPYLSQHFGYQRGFDHFDDSFEGDRSRLSAVAEAVKRNVGAVVSRNDRLQSLVRRAFTRLTGNPKPYVDAAETTSKVLEYLDGDPDRPYFLWAHYLDPHEPYRPPPEYRDGIDPERLEELNTYVTEDRSDVTERDVEDLRSLYRGEIRYVDDQLARLFEGLRERGELADTALVITADHGEEFMDHGELSHHPRLYQELLHVPLLVHGPELDPRVVDDPVDLLSIAPTVTDLLDLEPDDRFLGSSLLAADAGGTVVSEVSNPHGVLKVKNRYRKRSVRDGRWKLIVDYGADERRLYDLSTDPGETEDRSDAEPDVLQKMESLLETRESLTAGVPE